MRALVPAVCLALAVGFSPVSAEASAVAATNLLPEPCDISSLIGHYAPTCDDLRVGQCFTPNSAGHLVSVEMPLSVIGAEDLMVEIYSSDEGVPGTLLGSVNVPSTEATQGTGRSGRNLVTATFLDAEIQLDLNMEYVIVLSTGSSTSYRVSCGVRDSYTTGRGYISRNGGDWYDLFLPESDISFQVNVSNPVTTETATWGSLKSRQGTRR